MSGQYSQPTPTCMNNDCLFSAVFCFSVGFWRRWRRYSVHGSRTWRYRATGTAMNPSVCFLPVRPSAISSLSVFQSECPPSDSLPVLPFFRPFVCPSAFLIVFTVCSVFQKSETKCFLLLFFFCFVFTFWA